MNCINYSSSLRVNVTKTTVCGSKYLKIMVQEKRLLFWRTVDKLYVEVERYWGYIPGHAIFGKCLKMSWANGQNVEIWPPDIFDLKHRAHELIKDYLHKKTETDKSINKIDQELRSISHP